MDLVLALSRHTSERESSVWQVIDMPALFLRIVILSFSLLSVLQTQMHLITRELGQT